MSEEAIQSLPVRVDETLNEIVERWPQALPILRGYGLDLCCGGGLTLSEAVTAHQLSLPEVLAKLVKGLSQP